MQNNLNAPNALTYEKMRRLWTDTTNRKHACLILLLCKLCLRPGQVRFMLKTDWDMEKGLLYVLNEDNERVPITLTLEEIQLLNLYQQAYHTEVYLFEGNTPSEPLCEPACNKPSRKRRDEWALTNQFAPINCTN